MWSEGEGLILSVQVERLSIELRRLQCEVQHLHDQLAAERQMNLALSTKPGTLYDDRGAFG